jgi:hypothetical protein
VHEIYGEDEEERPQKRSRICDEPSNSEESEELLRNNNRHPPTQPPATNAKDLDFETADSDSEDETDKPPEAANNSANNNLTDCDDEDDYEPLQVRLQNAHREDYSRILDVHDLDPGQLDKDDDSQA